MRVTISANASPSAVQPAAHASASSSVFHATPQRPPPARHARPQIFSVVTRATNAAGAKTPSLFSSACTRIVATGKNVNTATSAPTATTPPATNASPLK